MAYLLNRWYCAGWSTELKAQPVGRTLLEKPVVLYRDAEGAPVAIGGRCPHRFAPLHKGQVVNDTLVCPYHGLAFNRNGMCVYNPHGDGMIPGTAKVPSYPVIEKNGALWVWLGDPAAADPSQLSDTGWLVDPGYASFAGYLRVNANYQLVIDNLLDLTHAPYVHPTTLGGDPEDTVGQGMEHSFTVEQQEIIHSDYLVRNLARPSPVLLPLWGNRPGDFRAEMIWRPATTLELDIRMSPEGADKTTGVHMPSLHYLVPESETVTHYFFAMGRNVLIDDAELSEIAARMARQAFEMEDEPMIRDCQEMMGGATDLFALKPVILKTDIAGVQARRMLTKLIAREQQTA